MTSYGTSYPVFYGGGSQPTFVFTPLSGVGMPSQAMKVWNNSPNPAYIGPLATLCTPNALPVAIAPNATHFFNPLTTATYVCGNYSAGTITTTISASATTAGSTTFTCSTTVPSSYAAGTAFLLGNSASGKELRK